MTPVPTDRLGPLWPWVKAGLEDIIARFGVDWTVGEVFTALTSGNAVLYVAGAEDGFVVVQRHVYKYGPVLFVWVAYGDLAEGRDEHTQFLDELARAVGADRIRMHSPRKGWQRCGFKVKSMIYEREVSNG